MLHDEPCYIVVAKDVTSAHEEEQARQQRAHVARLAMLGEMAATIAHEVNQPLGAILSNADAADMLLDQPTPRLAEIKQILSDIRRDDRRASAVVKRVRALVGRREIRQEPLELNEAIEETIKLVSSDARRRGVTLLLELAENLPEIRADAGQLQQALLNLFLTAMDAMKDTPVASRKIVVRSSARNGDSVAASVEDCGHGIPADKIGKVFDTFFTTKEGGMGLGLALARSIAEAHGGYLFAENNTSAGATFHLILPMNSVPSDVGTVCGNSDRPPRG
jgi:two-component system sensor kinase FixL